MNEIHHENFSIEKFDGNYIQGLITKEYITDLIDEVLTVREKDILMAHFFSGETLDEIGSKYSITRQAIFKVKKAAVKKLFFKIMDQRNSMKDFFESDIEIEYKKRKKKNKKFIIIDSQTTIFDILTGGFDA